ncbi:MAG: magnesium/cobalt transporter CorA [Sandaracinaceae bacterium]|nr:magnesium/cobalt transporter CorA [Sandaracinaceae bacterium]
MATRILAVRRTEHGPERVHARVDDLKELLEDPEVVVWVDLDSQGDESQRILAEIFEFHPLLIEDAFADATTPKIEDFGDYLYLIVHGLSDADPSGDGEVHTADLDLFLGPGYLITHYRLPFKAVTKIRDRVEKHPSHLAKGPAVIAHQIIDVLVDEYLPMMEKLDQEVDHIEERILADSSPDLLEHIFRMKHSLQRIRRVGLHQKALLLSLAEGKYPLIPEAVRPFFRDVYDHMVRVTDLNEVYRDLMDGSLDAYLGVQSHKLNEVMRVLTIFSTVMLPLTFITGLYGMNFDELPYMHQQWGFGGAVFIMVAVAVSMIFFFKRRRWL